MRWDESRLDWINRRCDEIGFGRIDTSHFRTDGLLFGQVDGWMDAWRLIHRQR